MQNNKMQDDNDYTRMIFNAKDYYFLHESDLQFGWEQVRYNDGDRWHLKTDISYYLMIMCPNLDWTLFYNDEIIVQNVTDRRDISKALHKHGFIEISGFRFRKPLNPV